jgi:hypothetical protein
MIFSVLLCGIKKSHYVASFAWITCADEWKKSCNGITIYDRT